MGSINTYIERAYRVQSEKIKQRDFSRINELIEKLSPDILQKDQKVGTYEGYAEIVVQWIKQEFAFQKKRSDIDVHKVEIILKIFQDALVDKSQKSTIIFSVFNVFPHQCWNDYGNVLEKFIDAGLNSNYLFEIIKNSLDEKRGYFLELIRFNFLRGFLSKDQTIKLIDNVKEKQPDCYIAGLCVLLKDFPLEKIGWKHKDVMERYFAIAFKYVKISLQLETCFIRAEYYSDNSYAYDKEHTGREDFIGDLILAHAKIDPEGTIVYLICDGKRLDLDGKQLSKLAECFSDCGKGELFQQIPILEATNLSSSL